MVRGCLRRRTLRQRRYHARAEDAVCGSAADPLFTIGAALIGHAYWTIPDAAQKAQQKIHFFKDVAIIGGLLFVFVRGAGPISIDRR
jgi:uncharacterized membrane protein YphA (DoxX/SURF4 family)